ncbi:regulatory protein [Frankineae bacterium MT45]|nr:regulatory protein [Frankineae bacterium MT45]
MQKQREAGSPEQLDPPGDPASVARTICLQQLATRARSRAELSAVLLRRGVPQEAAEPVLDRFAELGLIDDAAYAGMVVRAQHAERGLSRRAVALSLRQRGVSDSDAESALSAIDAESELHTARRLAEKKLRSLAGLDTSTQQRRIFGLLARRGYSAGLAARVCRETIGGSGASGTDHDSDLDS